MPKPLLILAVCFGLNVVCFAQNALPLTRSTHTNTLIVNDHFSESNLLGYVYAFSTADSRLGVRDIRTRSRQFRRLTQEIPHFGSDNRYHWVRTDIQNAGTQPAQLVSYLHLNELTDVGFYVVNAANQVVYQQEHFSQRTRFSEKPIPTRYFAFPVNLSPTETVSVYWRIYRDANSVVAPFRLYTKASFDSFLLIYDSLAFLCLGVIFSAFLFSFILFFITRSIVLFYYAGYCLFYFFLCIINDGIVLQYFHIDPFEIAIGIRLLAAGLMLFFLLQFSKYFLGAKKLISPLLIKFTDFWHASFLRSPWRLPFLLLTRLFLRSFFFLAVFH